MPTDTLTAPGRRPHPQSAAVLDLLHQGVTDTEISNRLQLTRTTVRRIRQAHGLPKQSRQPLTLNQKWELRTQPLTGGHLVWTGERSTGSRTPVLHYKNKVHSAAGIAFRQRTGRDPVGYARAECGLLHCVAPGHVDDTSTRQRDRQALRDLLQMRPAPETCGHGHDQSAHGRRAPDGRSYCRACRLERAGTTTKEA